MSLKERFGIDIGVFKDFTTWKAFGIGIVLFSMISYAGLSMFDLASSSYGVDRDNIRLAPDFEVESLNRSTEDSPHANETGWFKLSDQRGKAVVVLDFMAIDCGNCHIVQAHLEKKLDEWKSYDGEYEIIVVSVGMWYDEEDLDSNEEILPSCHQIVRLNKNRDRETSFAIWKNSESENHYYVKHYTHYIQGLE